MSVTIHQNPETYTPSDNPVVWTFSSNQTGQANFVYLVEVYVNGVLTANELVFPESGIYSKFDASGYASTACALPNTDTSGGLITDAANNAEIYLIVRERYGSPPADQANATTNTVTVWKARLNDDDFINYDSTDYTINAITNRRFLTNFPGGYAGDTLFPNVRKDEGQIYLMAITNEIDVVDFTIDLYDSNDSLIQDYAYTPATSGNKITVFNLTPSVIIANTTLTQGNFDDAAYMEVSAANYLSTFRIEFDTSCVYSSYKRLHFLTEIGSIDSFTFGLLSKRMGTIKTYGYRRNFGDWDGSSYSFNRASGRDQDYAKVAERKIELESDWLNEEVQYWLVTNCYESPANYLEYFPDGTLQRRSILNTSWMEKYNENDTLFREKVTLKEATKTSSIV